MRGYDALHRLRKRQPVRAHVQVALADLARELTADAGLTVDAATPGPLWRYLIQHRQSDLELLVELANRCGLHLAVRGSTLHLVTLEGLGPALPLVVGGNLLEASVEVNADPACRSVSAAGWDTSEVEPTQGQATRARLGREVSAEAPPGNVGGSGERMLADASAPSADHAEAAAQAELDDRAAREVVLRGVAEGDPRLRPAAKVDLRGVAPDVAGTYVLTEVTHTLDAQHGFVSALSTEPPARRPRPDAAAAVLGTITRVDDPRTAACAPSCPPSPTSRRTGCRCERGRRLRQGIHHAARTWMIWCSSSAPTATPPRAWCWAGCGAGRAQGRRRRQRRGEAHTLRTAAGHVLVLDDAEKTIRLEDPTGSSLHLSPDHVLLHSARRPSRSRRPASRWSSPATPSTSGGR